MSTFSPEVRGMLTASGWLEGRTVDLTAAENSLLQRRITPPNAARRFLSEFDGLTIRTRGGPFYFGVLESLLHLGAEDIPYLSALCDEPLCPVGWGLFLFLLIAPNSDLVVLTDHWRRYARFAERSDAFDLIFLPGCPPATWIDLRPEQWPPGYQDLD